MRAHVINNNIIVNTIEVNTLDHMPGLIDGSQGGSIGDTWDGEAFISPLPEITPALVPVSVTMRQARLTLLSMGLIDDVEIAINAIEDNTIRKSVQIEWEYAMDIRRDWPALQMITQQLGITSDQLDQMFIAAAQI